MSEWIYLRNDDFATKLTTGRGLPADCERPDAFAIWRLANRSLLVDTEAGVVCRSDGETRAERAAQNAYGVVYLGRFHGRVRFARAHRIVWIAKHGPIPGMYEINHRNGLRWDNRIENLDLVTHEANMRHAHKHAYEHVPGVPFLGEEDRPEINPYANSGSRLIPERRKRSYL